MATWLIQDNVFDEPFYDKMIDLFERLDMKYLTVKSVPFSGEMIPQPNIEGDVVSIGSYSFTNRCREIWSPGSWTNDNFDYRIWSNQWSHVLNKPADIYKFGEVPKSDQPFFIRPCADDKLFTGQVIEDWNKFEEWQKKVCDLGCYTELNYDSPVVVAEPCKIEDEYRFVVVYGELITGSLYGLNKGYKEIRRGDNPDLWKFVEDRIEEWRPADVFVIDIAVSGGNFWVLEMGNMNSAGLYHCDVQAIVFAIENMLEAQKRKKLCTTLLNSV
jgi:hypothetical protein